jgi:hypothetical protein
VHIVSRVAYRFYCHHHSYFRLNYIEGYKWFCKANDRILFSLQRCLDDCTMSYSSSRLRYIFQAVCVPLVYRIILLIIYGGLSCYSSRPQEGLDSTIPNIHLTIHPHFLSVRKWRYAFSCMACLETMPARLD